MKRLEWSDLDDATRERAVAFTIRRCRVSRHEAEDVVASAVLRLMKDPPLVRNPKGLLIETSLNLLREQRRRPPDARLLPAETRDGDRETDADDAIPEPIDARPDPAADLAGRDTREKLLAALARLAPADRALLSAFYFEGRPPASIDEARGDKPGTAKLRIHRARVRLMREFHRADAQAGWSL